MTDEPAADEPVGSGRSEVVKGEPKDDVGGGRSIDPLVPPDNVDPKPVKAKAAASNDDHGFPQPWHPGDEEYENEEDKWQNIKACGCIPRVISGNFGCIDYYINPLVMTLSIIIIWGFVIWCAGWPEEAGIELALANTWVTDYFGWFYVLCLAIFGTFCLVLCFSKYGDIVLGPPNEPPKYSYATWFAMLFSAGVGIGLYFFGVAEPVWHLTASQAGTNKWYDLSTNGQALAALNLTWFHWGFCASAVYVVAALPLAYHHHVHNEPIRESVCFIILIGHKYANGIIGHLIDLTSVVSTMFGVATSLGLGVIQINAGLEFAFGAPNTIGVQMLIIWGITLLATVSVLTGLDRGIRRLSEINFNFSLLILFFIFFASETIFLLNLVVQTFGYHLQYQLQLIFDTHAFEQAGFLSIDPENVIGTDFYDGIDMSNRTAVENAEQAAADTFASQAGYYGGWTVFYWAWWIAWAPFVGIFIAQISRGRTIREFILGNMMVPTLFTCLWLGIFGAFGLYNEMGSIQNDISCPSDITNHASPEFREAIVSYHDGNEILKLSCYATAEMLWAALTTLPLVEFTQIITLIGIGIYFITSSDSASHVIDVLTASGLEEPPKLQRIFWALSEGAVASVLLAQGPNALTALQTASLVAAMPFAFVLLCETYATWLTLKLHCGEYKPRTLNYWRYDIFAAWQNYAQGIVLNVVWLIVALICPPYFQTMTRLNMIKLGSMQSGDSVEDENGERLYQPGPCNYVWYAAYWGLWLAIVILAFCEISVTGAGSLALCFYLFYLGLCVINRSQMLTYYEIDSSGICYGLLSWLCCPCCAAIQENLQSMNSAETSIELQTKQQSKNNEVYSE